MKRKSSLDQLDQWFASKGTSANTYFLAALAVACLIVYLILGDPADRYLQDSETYLEKATNSLQKAQDEYNGPFEGDPDAFVQRLRDKLNEEKVARNNIIEERNYIDGKLKDISKLTYNEENWATFMDSLSTIAENNNIKIYAIHSDRRAPSVEQNFKPEALLDIDVKFEGAFPNVLRYINLIEQSEMIVDVNKMDINATKNGKIGGSIGISIWGVNYQ
ncbi:hypothetical protein [uncultured Campylobacter sp.]|uniref:hypothetical protein n=1 Tax=uncultured Campylobacter sp. TaxID=218934 RepID=UPI00262997CC|nr:hypothetical protein [uncultured Campylobacter sp.]